MRLVLSGAVACAIGVLLLSGCGGSDASDSLQEGVYASELTEQYLLDNGISEEQAANESGVHTLTLANNGFTDKWSSSNGTEGFCSGTYKADGTRVTFSWISGCFGDWEMTYSIDGDTVTWSGMKSLPPNDSAEDQKVNEVFNGVPWVRTGDAPSQ
jgi:hypothetical protein